MLSACGQIYKQCVGNIKSARASCIYPAWQKNRYLLPSSGLWVHRTLINRLPDLSEDNLDNTLSLCILISFPLTTRTRLNRAMMYFNKFGIRYILDRESLIKSFDIHPVDTMYVLSAPWGLRITNAHHTRELSFTDTFCSGPVCRHLLSLCKWSGPWHWAALRSA